MDEDTAACSEGLAYESELSSRIGSFELMGNFLVRHIIDNDGLVSET